jgi:hypothetical protein
VEFGAVIRFVELWDFGLLYGLERRRILGHYRACRDVRFWATIRLVDSVIVSGYRACRDVGFWAAIRLVDSVILSCYRACRDVEFRVAIGLVDTLDFELL